MFFTGKKVLIIGGTGSIGCELLKQIICEKPEVIRIFSRDEYKQYVMVNKVGKKNNLRFLIGDVRDYERVFTAMQDIDYVFHLAAMKQVPACEYNPFEAVMTNIIGTNNVIKAAKEQNVKKVIFASSDKAISPTNTYGATKLTAERLITAAENGKGKSKTTFASVRFGNVICSRGSVIPLFLKQIREEQRITVTDLTMTRFMMTVKQAGSLMIKALKESRGGEIFVLKMPVIVLKYLVEVVIEGASKSLNIPAPMIKIEEIGLRAGEKMFEELMTYDESLTALELPEMFIIPPNFQNTYEYPNAKKAKLATYSSHDQEPLTKEEVMTLLEKEDIFG